MLNLKTAEIKTESYLTKSKLPDADYVINPYVGCPHKCIYCYAEFMKRFCGHTEEWGDFVDVKICDKPINLSRIPSSSTILVGSVTDAYNPLEKKYKITRSILQQLINWESRLEVLTKSDLVVRDIDLLSQIKNAAIGISINTVDDELRKNIEPFAPSVEKRINALKELHEAGIKTYLFMSPIFPRLTEWRELINAVLPYVDYICFENLNLRGAYLPRVMGFIHNSYPQFEPLYKAIYWNKDMSYWESLKDEITAFCNENAINYRFYFYHEKIKKQ